MKISLTFDGDLRAEAYATATAFRNGVDAAMDKTGKQTLDFARVAMRSALGPKAANTVGRKNFIDANAPLQVGIYDRWWRGAARSGGTSPPAAFWLGATVRPREAKFLAVPSQAVIQNTLPAGLYDPGSLPTNARINRAHISGRSYSVNARMSPAVFEQATGVPLRYVPPGGGRRYGLLVADNARVTRTGGVRGAKLKKPRYTFVAFILLPQTQVPQKLEWGTVIDYSGDQLAQNVATMVPAALEGGAPAFSVSAT
jgi:hypothetical protein